MNNKIRILGFVTGIILIIGVVTVQRSQAKYQQTQEMRLVNGNISYKPSDLEIMAMYQKDSASETTYKEITKMPSEGYLINEEKSYCEVNGSKDIEARLFTNDSGDHVMKNLQKNSKCILYFDRAKTMDEILASYNIGSRGSFSSSYTATTTKTIFTASDGLGTSKYFAGAPTDNYVKFAGFYWRIIRMNGDKTTRLIYSGKANFIDNLSNKEAVLANGYNDATTKYFTVLSGIEFNKIYSDNAYVGFKYNVGSLRGTSYKSTILDALDTWYKANLKTNLEKYIDGNTGFCGDRTPYTDIAGTTSGGGTYTTVTYYGAYIRLYKNNSGTTSAPSLSCANNSDLYTVYGSNKGNKSLTNPVGLINADEVAFAGVAMPLGNTKYYLNTGCNYWTITPFGYFSNFAEIGIVDYNGGITVVGSSATNNELRPVINLSSSTRFNGSGTWDDPFVVV